MRPANWRDPVLDLAVIGPAFQLLLKRWKEYALLGFLGFMLIVVFALPGYIFMMTTLLGNRNPGLGEMLAIYPVVYGGIFLGVVLAFPFQFGITSFTLREVQYGDATLADAWLPLKSYFKYMGAGAAIVLAQVVSTVCGCIIGGLIVSGLLLFTMPIMMHEGLGVFDAMKESYERCKPQMLMAVVVMLVTQLISGLGEIACFVGVFLTYPMVYIIPAMLYLNGFASANQPGPIHSPYPRGQETSSFGSPSPPAADQELPPRPEDMR